MVANISILKLLLVWQLYTRQTVTAHITNSYTINFLIMRKGFRYATKKDMFNGNTVYGNGWDGKFQMGIVDENYIIFKNEYGGVKQWSSPVWDAPAFHFHTVHGDLYVKLK